MVADKFFSNVTIRGRIAFTLIVAEQNLTRIKPNAPGYAWARKSLKLVSRWLAGDTVSPKDFSHEFFNEKDEGLMAFEANAIGEEKKAWLVIEDAVGYAAWNVYSLAKEAMPEFIRLIGEEGIRVFIEDSINADPSNGLLMEKLSVCCIAKFGAHDARELGSPIDRAGLDVLALESR